MTPIYHAGSELFLGYNHLDQPNIDLGGSKHGHAGDAICA